MDCLSTQSVRKQMAPKDSNTIVPATKYHSPIRTPSSSSSSSSSSLRSFLFPRDLPLSPPSPLQFSGIPFSWEHSPGVPKKLQSHKKKDSTKLLPLPPPATPPTSKKMSESFRKDPFFMAMIECSRDNDNSGSSSNIWTGIKVARSISDRFGFINLHTSCKRTCAVSESLIYLPRPTGTPNYDLIARRSRQM
ncbi:Protease-associated RING/U-box zinc finger family protein [Hibiscus syriacus]|uniref:Protease-associated RING/U-box zinc finger family protein n=1 Tax=Hibiscus syriacus TaxID=106335 RepID=A0A6A2WK10_HIBSY|nr:Protease-associated RING/U-box zinc finger family protein [Hibiscus syriacus]